jgi:hypothetical protein
MLVSETNYLAMFDNQINEISIQNFMISAEKIA